MPSLAHAQSVWGGTGSTTTTTDYNLGTNWSNPPAGAPPVAAGQSAQFSNTGTATVVVTAGPIAPQSWTFTTNSQSYTITGQAVNFATGITNNANAGQAISVANNITGGGLTQNGASTLTLSGANTYAGATTVNGGTLHAGSAGAFSFSSATTINSGGTLDLGGFLQNISTVSLAGGTLQNGSLGGAVSSSGGTISGLGGSATVTTTGGLTTLTGSNSYGGTTAVNGGTLAAGNANAFSAASSTIVNIGGTLDFVGTAQTINVVLLKGGTMGNGSLTGVVSSTGGTITGLGGSATVVTTSGVTALLGSNTYTGATNISGGTLTGGAVNAFSAVSASTINTTGTLDLGGFTQTANTVNLNGGTLTNGSLTSAGGIASTGGAVNNIGGSTAFNATNGFTTFTGSNTYTGATNIAAAAITFVGNANAYSANSITTVSGGLNLGGVGVTQTINTVNLTGGGIGNGNLTSTNGIASTGGTVYDLGGSTSLSANGSFTFLANINTYTGATTINGGATLAGGNANAFSAASTTAVNSGGTLDLDGVAQTINAVSLAGGTLQHGSLTGAVSSSGGTVNNVDGAMTLTTSGGTTTLTGNNTYSGATNLNAGFIEALSVGGFSASSAFTVASGATLDLNSFNESIGSLAGAGSVTNGSGIATAMLTTGADNTSKTFSGTISDGGLPLSLTKVGSGTQILSGNNSYTGATSVNGGTLEVDGSIASSRLTMVNANATLTGTGTVGATQVNSGGIFTPGSGTPGTSMTVTGSLVLASAAQYLVQINPTTSSSANVTGAATLGGATVNAVFANGSYVDKKYTILNAGSVSGTFGALVDNNLPSGFHTSLSYDATHAYIDLALNFVPPSGTGLNVNQQNVGNAIINFFNTTGSIPLVFGGLTPAGLTQISGETATGSQQTTFDAMNQFMGVMTDPLLAGRGDPISGGGNPNAYADEESLAYAAGKPRSQSERDAYAAIYRKAPPIAPSFEQRWSVWAAGFGGSQTTGGNAAAGSNDTKSSIYGAAVGADYRFSPDTLAGFALAGGGTNFSVNGFGSGRSDLFQAGAFIRHTIGAAYLTGALAYGWQDVTTDRTVTVAGVDRLRAEFNANTWSGRLEGGYRFVSPWIGGVGITPYAAGQFTTFELPNYAESVVSGAGMFALAYAAKSVTDTRSELGLRTDKSFAMADGVLTLRGRAAWAHDFNPDRSIGATFQTLPGASFVANGAARASDSALTTASAEMKWLNGWSTAATFEGEFSEVTRSYAGKGVVRYAW